MGLGSGEIADCPMGMGENFGDPNGRGSEIGRVSLQPRQTDRDETLSWRLSDISSRRGRR